MAKILIGCFLAFLLPVILAAFLVPDVFFSKNQATQISKTEPVDAQALSSSPSSLSVSEAIDSNGKIYVEVPSSEDLDPKPTGIFLASVKFIFSKLPEEGKSVRFFTKYQEDKWPFPGWGLKIKRQTGSIRPEVYWMGTNGRGGWYSFGEMDLKEDHWSSLSIAVDRKNSISLYFQDLDNEADSTGIVLPKFVGGFTVSEIPLPVSQGSLKLLLPVSSKNSDIGSIHDLLVARLEQPEGAMLKLVNGGPSEMAQRIKTENINLWVDARGRDRSSKARKLIRSE